MILLYTLLCAASVLCLIGVGFLVVGSRHERTQHGSIVIFQYGLILASLAVISGGLALVLKVFLPSLLTVTFMDYFKGFVCLNGALVSLVSGAYLWRCAAQFLGTPWWTPDGEEHFGKLDRIGRLKRRFFMLRHYGPKRPVRAIGFAVLCCLGGIAAVFWSLFWGG